MFAPFWLKGFRDAFVVEVGRAGSALDQLSGRFKVAASGNGHDSSGRAVNNSATIDLAWGSLSYRGILESRDTHSVAVVQTVGEHDGVFHYSFHPLQGLVDV